MLRAGIPPRVVAARLGHDPAVLMRTYAWVMDGDDRAASDALGAARRSLG
jgi:hypothetical protein